MWLSPWILTSAVVISHLTSAVFNTPECLVKSTITGELTGKKFHKTFWGFINNVEAGSFLKVRLYETPMHYMSIECNHTHMKYREVELSSEQQTSRAESLSWTECPEWRQFSVAVDQNTLSMTDIHHNRTFIKKTVNFTIKNFEVIMENFSDSCYQATPLWKVRAGKTREIVLPRHWDAIFFTLAADEKVTPQITVGNCTFRLDQLSPSQARLFSLKRVHTDVSRLVSSPIGRKVVEVGCMIRNVTLSGINGRDGFKLLQHLHMQECPSEVRECGTISQDSKSCFSNMVIFLVFIWTGAASNTIVFCCLLRRFLMERDANRQVPLPLSSWNIRSASPRNPLQLKTNPAALLSVPMPGPYPPFTTNN